MNLYEYEYMWIKLLNYFNINEKQKNYKNYKKLKKIKFVEKFLEEEET